MKKKQYGFLFTVLTFVLVLVGCDSTDQSSSKGSDSTSSSSSPVISTDLPEQALASVQTAVEINGTYSVGGFTHIFTTIFSETSYYNVEYYYNDDYPEVVILFDEYNLVLENDEVFLRQTNADNTITKTKVNYDWSEFESPFKDLSIHDFAYDDLFDWYEVATNKALALGNAITNWNHTQAKSMIVKVENDVITSMEATLSTAYDGDIVYEMTFKNHGTATAPEVVYERQSEHDALEAAFKSFNNQNYTVTVSDNAYSLEDQEYDVTYQLYRTESAWWHDYEKTGYARYNDSIYDFTVENNQAVLGEEVTDFNPFSYTPTLTVAPELFTMVKEGTYKLINSFLVSKVITSFALSTDLLSLGYSFGMDLYVYVNQNQLTGFSFNYNVQTLYAQCSFEFRNVGTTTMPFNMEFGDPGGDDDPDIAVIPTEYIGSYTGELSKGTFNETTTIQIEITADTITVNGVEATIVSYDDYEGFTLILNEAEYYLYNMDYSGGVILAFMSSDYATMGTGITKNTTEDPGGDDPVLVVIPTEYIGSYTGELSKGTFNETTTIQIEITADTITVNGVEATIVAFNEYEGFTLMINDVEYYLMNSDYTGGIVLAFMSSDYATMGTGITKNTTEEPEGDGYKGTWTKTDSADIVFTFDGNGSGTFSNGSGINIEFTYEVTSSGIEFKTQTDDSVFVFVSAKLNNSNQLVVEIEQDYEPYTWTFNLQEEVSKDAYEGTWEQTTVSGNFITIDGQGNGTFNNGTIEITFSYEVTEKGLEVTSQNGDAIDFISATINGSGQLVFEVEQDYEPYTWTFAKQ